MENYKPTEAAKESGRDNQEIWNLVGLSPLFVRLSTVLQELSSLYNAIYDLGAPDQHICDAYASTEKQLTSFEIWCYDKLSKRHGKPSEDSGLRHMVDARYFDADEGGMSWERQAFHYSPAHSDDPESVLMR